VLVVVHSDSRCIIMICQLHIHHDISMMKNHLCVLENEASSKIIRSLAKRLTSVPCFFVSFLLVVLARVVLLLLDTDSIMLHTTRLFSGGVRKKKVRQRMGQRQRALICFGVLVLKSMKTRTLAE